MTVRLRPAEIGDLDKIWRIERDVFPHDAWSRELVREELSGPHRHYVVLVDAAKRIIGYAGLLAVGEQGDVQTVAVRPEERGQGHGRRLMLALADEAARRDVREMFLEVRADNPVARALYVSLGFLEIGVRPRYYQPGAVDAIVMRAGIAPMEAQEGEST